MSKGVWFLDVGRFSVGYGIGLLSYVVLALEFDFYIWLLLNVTLEAEGICICNSKQLMICIGVSITYLVGTFVTWRILALIGIIPCVLQLLGLFFIPESPRWLAKNDRWLDCEAALQRLRGQSANITEEATEIRYFLCAIKKSDQLLPLKDYTETLQKLAAAKVLDLFQRKYAHSLIVGVGLMVLQQFGGVNGIAYYASAIFESAGFSGKVGTWAMVIVQVPMTLLGVLLMDKSGRRALLMISAAGTCLGCFLVGLSYLLQDLQVWKDFSPIMALGGVLVKRRSSIPNFSFLILESGVYGVLFIRHGRNSMGDHVRDISHKHERFGRKPCYSSQLARDLDYFIYLQLLNGLELRR
ncbi:hypothetical protein RHGRI_021222 [Rhododendron griersonianum]|uniref:Major facilitator superfamily (MFS) profile domain-containing protein n=1 Tax=Rhododendron griersonianum TaxID=479676 RepID=A0AAV6JKU5_9ERIC|nr:hypothetical protein RHGRI_021222 [Rhododendron griersonianum]